MGVVSPRLLPPHEGSAIGWGHGETNRPKCLFVVPLFWLTFQFSVAVAKGADENPSGGWTTLGQQQASHTCQGPSIVVYPGG